MRILLAEDERELSRAICAILTHHQYQVDAVGNGVDALEYSNTNSYDGIILDIMMPEMNGLDALKNMRERNLTIPVMLLTAKSTLVDRVAGLDTGADAYLCKPFAMEELLARLRAMLRRKADYTPNTLELGNICLNRSSYELAVGGVALRLCNREFQVLELLMNRPDRMITEEQLLELVWRAEEAPEPGVVSVYLSYLRKKLAALGADLDIEVTRDDGCRLVARK